MSAKDEIIAVFDDGVLRRIWLTPSSRSHDDDWIYDS